MTRMTTIGTAALIGATLLAGCGSAGPSCEQAVANAARLRSLDEREAARGLARCKKEGWPSALRSCAAGAKTADELERCTRRARPSDPVSAFEDYQAKSKAMETTLRLKQLERALKTVYAENGAFPVGEAGPSPAAGSCCAGPNHKCAPDPTLWAGAKIWSDLDFSVDEPTYYSFAYRADDATHAVVQALGDLDCDGEIATSTLRCEVVDGAPICTVEPAARGAD